jgi:hypothetical protein
MALREKMREGAAPHLQPGEPVDAVIAAQTAPQLLILVGVLIFVLINRYRMLVVSPTHITVLDCGRWRMTKPKSVLAVVPRVPLGPPTGTLFHKVTINGETLRIHRRFFADLNQVG